METTRLEELLQELIEKNSTIIDELRDTRAALDEIKEELNWIREHSFAKRLLDQLDGVESAIRNIGS
jgi:hypothetical protein